MGRITPSFRQLYEEIISELRTELQAVLVDLGHKGAFDLLLKEAWNPAPPHYRNVYSFIIPRRQSTPNTQHL